MIFLAVAAPTPGSASRSFCDAVLRSTFAEEADDDDDEADFAGGGAGGGAALVVRPDPAAGAGAEAAAAGARPALTRPEIFSMVAAETPARERSETEE